MFLVIFTSLLGDGTIADRAARTIDLATYYVDGRWRRSA